MKDKVGIWGILFVAIFSCELAYSETSGSRQSAEHLRMLLWKSMTGKRYELIESSDKKSYSDVVITGVTAQGVEFTHAKGETALAFEKCPEAWVDAFALETPSAASSVAGEPKQKQAGRNEDGSATGPGTDVDHAIVVIIGDKGTGTGFIAKTDDKSYLYTAAHVLSGGSKLKVKLYDGKLLTQFGAFETADGGDMVRIELKDPAVMTAMKTAATTGVSAVGMEIFACGNSGGGGTVGHERGKVLSVGPELVEIDAQVISGNSGGPIVDGRTNAVLGVVTHLTQAENDTWSKETRFEKVRRFGCRLDREWQWKKLPIEIFLQEGRVVSKTKMLTELMASALDKWNSPIFSQMAEDPLAKDIILLKKWVEEQRVNKITQSETERKRRLRGILQSALTRSRAQIAALNYAGYTWFHHEELVKDTQYRKAIDKEYASVIDSLK